MVESFNHPNFPAHNGTFASAAWAPVGRTLYISGTIPQTMQTHCVGVGDVRAQTRQVLENIRQVLDHAGGTMDDIAMVKVYVMDMGSFEAIHEVRREFFKPPYPASTLVQVVALAHPDWLVEIDAVAVIPDRRGFEARKS